MSATMTGPWSITLALVGLVAGYFATLFGVVVFIICLAHLSILVLLVNGVIGWQVYGGLTVQEVMRRTGDVMLRVFRGQTGTWLDHVPWIWLLAGGFLRSGHNMMLAWGEA